VPTDIRPAFVQSDVPLPFPRSGLQGHPAWRTVVAVMQYGVAIAILAIACFTLLNMVYRAFAASFY
jgi:hypothetical protein